MALMRNLGAALAVELVVVLLVVLVVPMVLCLIVSVPSVDGTGCNLDVLDVVVELIVYLVVWVKSPVACATLVARAPPRHTSLVAATRWYNLDLSLLPLYLLLPLLCRAAKFGTGSSWIVHVREL